MKNRRWGWAKRNDFANREANARRVGNTTPQYLQYVFCGH